MVVCDFGGILDGYCSDITRTVCTGEPSPEMAEHVRGHRRSAGGRRGRGDRRYARAATSTAPPATSSPTPGYGEFFPHRTGHGIGRDVHEDPYLVDGNNTLLEAGNAFSVEPGIYLPGRFGARLEDIVVATEDGPVVAQQSRPQPRRRRLTAIYAVGGDNAA